VSTQQHVHKQITSRSTTRNESPHASSAAAPSSPTVRAHDFPLRSTGLHRPSPHWRCRRALCQCRTPRGCRPRVLSARPAAGPRPAFLPPVVVSSHSGVSLFVLCPTDCQCQCCCALSLCSATAGVVAQPRTLRLGRTSLIAVIAPKLRPRAREAFKGYNHDNPHAKWVRTCP
jgi:hypothetical protein